MTSPAARDGGKKAGATGPSHPLGDYPYVNVETVEDFAKSKRAVDGQPLRILRIHLNVEIKDAKEWKDLVDALTADRKPDALTIANKFMTGTDADSIRSRSVVAAALT